VDNCELRVTRDVVTAKPAGVVVERARVRVIVEPGT
jgi:hypothetical protein